MLREMTTFDLENVIMVDLRAGVASSAGYTQLLPRRKELMSAYLTTGGGLVAEVDGLFVGFLFWHHWGSLGWLGPLAVDPVHQGYGIGKRLVDAGRAKLNSLGARVVGLETWPQEGKNLTLYSRLSFQWEGFCLLLTRSVTHGHNGIPQAPVDDLGLVRRVAGSVVSGFDPSSAVEFTIRQGLGDLFAEVYGFVLCQRGGSREGTHDLGLIKLLMVEPGAGRNKTHHLMETACAYFRAVGAREVLLPLYADQQNWLPDLLNQGWRIAGATMRASWPAPAPRPRGSAFYSLMG